MDVDFWDMVPDLGFLVYIFPVLPGHLAFLKDFFLEKNCRFLYDKHKRHLYLEFETMYLIANKMVIICQS